MANPPEAISQARMQVKHSRRIFAGLIDALVTIAVGFLLMLVTGAFEHAEDYAGSNWLYNLIFLMVGTYLLTHGWLLYSRGQTFGKALLGIEIVNAATGGKVEGWRLILRAPFILLTVIAILPPLTLVSLVDFGFMFTNSRQALHDRLCGTAVQLRNSVAE